MSRRFIKPHVTYFDKGIILNQLLSYRYRNVVGGREITRYIYIFSSKAAGSFIDNYDNNSVYFILILFLSLAIRSFEIMIFTVACKHHHDAVTYSLYYIAYLYYVTNS